MKIFVLCFVLSFFAVSCSIEPDSPSGNISNNGAELLINSDLPENKANPFDGKGKKYYDLLIAYLQNNRVPNSISEVTDQIQFLFANYPSDWSTGRGPLSISSEELVLIMNDPKYKLSEIIESSSLSSVAKLDLVNFIQTLSVQQDMEYAEVYKYIVSYESTIIESTKLSGDEKEIILSVSSVSRFALYAESGGGDTDRDWETSVANRKKQRVFDHYKASIVSVLVLFGKLV
ncbi:hypothetical protein D3C72_502210 [compost metagenome]